MDVEIGTEAAQFPEKEYIIYLYDSAHHLATVKSCPMFSYPSAWNEESIRKFNPSPKS
jgi:hypothetical protein